MHMVRFFFPNDFGDYAHFAVPKRPIQTCLVALGIQVSCMERHSSCGSLEMKIFFFFIEIFGSPVEGFYKGCAPTSVVKAPHVKRV